MRGGLCVHKALLVQQHMLVEHLGSGLDGKQRDLIELEAHILNILTCNFYSPASVCRGEKTVYFHMTCRHLGFILCTFH